MADSAYTKWYEATKSRLTGCGLWLRGNELNTVDASDYERRRFRVLFVRLSTYADVATSFTHSLLYQTAAAMPEVFPDLAYLPPPGDVSVFAEGLIPWCLGTQTKRGPKGFQLIGFSNAIVQELLNIPQFLKTSGIPLALEDRLSRADLPLLILGGANAAFSHLLWADSPLVDGVFIGENPKAIELLLHLCADGYKVGKSKARILQELEAAPGFLNLANPKSKAYRSENGEAVPTILTNGIVPYDLESMGTGWLQISEGCRSLCSFCAENWTHRPYREFPVPYLITKALELKANMGLDELNLYSFNFNAYTDFYALLWDLIPLFRRIGLKSQRFDMLAEEPECVEVQKAAGKASFSCGLDGISQRLRSYLSKSLEQRLLLESFRRVFKAGVRQVKIFVISTGLETEQDYAEFESLLAEIHQLKTWHAPGTRILFSITPLVRFPFTPLEFEAAPGLAVQREALQKLKKLIRIGKFEVRIAMELEEWALSQVLVRADDPKVRTALLKAIDSTGFVYYREVSQAFYQEFEWNLSQAGTQVDELLQGFDYEQSLGKPWARIGLGVDRTQLWSLRQKINSGQEWAPHHQQRFYPKRLTSDSVRARCKEVSKNQVARAILVDLNDNCRGIVRKYVGIALARAFMLSDPSLTQHYRYYETSHWSAVSSAPVWVIGLDVITLIWSREGAAIVTHCLQNPLLLAAVNERFSSWGAVIGEEQNPAFTVRFWSPVPCEIARYCKARGLKYTTYREGPDTLSLRFAKESLKKGLVSAIKITTVGFTDPPEWVVDVVPGPKFLVDDFLQEAFRTSDKDALMTIRVKAELG